MTSRFETFNKSRNIYSDYDSFWTDVDDVQVHNNIFGFED